MRFFGDIEVMITKRLGSESIPNDIKNIVKNLHSETVRIAQTERPSIWYDGKRVIAAYQQDQNYDAGYLVFFGVEGLSTTDIQTFGAFMRVVEDTLGSTVGVEFLQDQRRMLSRRTIVAQLRPNDLLYQAVRRLHKYINWERSAFILGSVNSDISHEWYVAAEKLRGVQEVSQRVGRRYGYDTTEVPQLVAHDFVVDRIQEFQRATDDPWHQLIVNVISDLDGLPSLLPRAESALVVCIGDLIDYGLETIGDRSHSPEQVPYAVVLTDVRPDRFKESHLQLAREFFSDIGPLITKSETVSERLIRLWMPPQRLKSRSSLAAPPKYHERRREDSDLIEALDHTELAAVAPEILGVDALQVIQISRGEARRGATSGSIRLLGAIVAEHERQFSQPTPLSSELVRDLKPDGKLTPEADLLWNVLRTGEENVHKNVDGVTPSRLGSLYPFKESPRAYNTVFLLPIYSEFEISGALIAYRRKTSEFADIDKFLLRSLASRLGERIVFHRQLSDRFRLTACLTQVAEAKSSAAARRALVEGACVLLNADHAFMMAVEESLDRESVDSSLEIIDVGHTWEDGAMFIPRIKAGADIEGITGTVYATGKALAVSDVKSFAPYIPLRNIANVVVPMASELAVPIIKPLSAKGTSRPILGVLDALWHEQHNITGREVNILATLADHAAAVLMLTMGLQDAQQMRDSLTTLLDRVKGLQEARNENDVMDWLASLIDRDRLIDCDLLAVWSHKRDSEVIDLRYVAGKRMIELENVPQLPFKSWVGSVIKNFRESKLKSAFDRHEKPSAERIHVPGTPKEAHQSMLAQCIVQSTNSAGDLDDPDFVWAVCLYRVRPSNFEERDEALLRIASEYCEGALQGLYFAETQARTLRLAKATQEIALELVNRLRGNLEEVIDSIIKRTYEELAASSVSVLYYDYETGVYAAPTRYSYPRRTELDEPPRADGICETVRHEGMPIIVENVSSPPSALVGPLRTSTFHNKHPEIRSIIACPLFESRDMSTTANDQFCGVMFVNFNIAQTPTSVEMEFLATMRRFLAECGGIGWKLQRSRTEALKRVHIVEDLSQVYSQILEAALEMLEDEFPKDVRSEPGFKICGNLYMVTSGANWERLHVRANVGEKTGVYAGVQNIGEGVVGQVAGRGIPILIDDTSSRTSLDLGYVPYLEGMRSELAVPIILQEARASLGAARHSEVADGVIGVLNVECSHPSAFTATRHQALLSRFAEPPVSLILYLAERHGQLLWEARKDDERFVLDAAEVILHDLTKPMRDLELKAKDMRESLSRHARTKVQHTLNWMESESRRWKEIEQTGVLYLGSEIIEALSKLDVVAQVTAWGRLHEPPIELERSSIDDFFIDRGHPDLIGRVLENLYRNSSKAQEKAGIDAGRIWMNLSLAPGIAGPAQYLDIYFNDNGPGIKTELFANLFRPFSGGRSSERPSLRDDGGWGLGLSVVRQMMHLMRGAVDIVDSIPFKKTTFRLRFQVAVD